MRKRNFTKQVGLILSEATYNQLIEQTNKEEVTISEWIRKAILTRLCVPNSATPASNQIDKDRRGKIARNVGR